MKAIIRYTAFLILLLSQSPLLYAQTILTKVTAPTDWKQKGLIIRLKDDLNHPQFSWPLTRVRYHLDFGAAGVNKNDIRVADMASGKPDAFQLSDVIENNGLVRTATLNILTDMPSGGDKSFRITVDSKAAKIGSEGVKIQKIANGAILDNGLIRIQIPSGGNQLQAPIVNYGNTKTWLGHGEMPASLKLNKLTVQEVSTGAIYAEYKLLYDLAGGRQYVVTIRLVKGMEFAEMEEEMTGFAPTEKLSWNLLWNGINTEYRYCPGRGDNVIDTKLGTKGGYNNINWEPMEGNGGSAIAQKHPDMDFDQQNQKDGKLPFSLAAYDNWISWWNLPTAAFWSEKQHITVGLFIKDTEKWNDGQYTLWTSKNNISINYYWNNSVLGYAFPLVAGTRSTAIATYDHNKDINLVNQTGRSLLYIDNLRRWYGWLNLDKTKNWVLNYDKPESGYPKYFKPENTNRVSVNALEQSLGNELRSLSYGSERNMGPTPVGTRTYYENIVPAFDVLANKMDHDEYTKLRAWYLFMHYVFMDESLMPVRTMLSGHPNFLSDIKGVSGLTAVLFPNHPEAKASADHFEKFVNLNFNFHIRPQVDAWDAKGGRWTENLSTYTWAALKPTVRTSALLHDYYDGRNRILQPGVSMLGNWLLNAMASPLSSQGNRRVFLPQGAHSNVYGNVPPDILRELAQGLVYYDPILAENLLWVTNAKDEPFEGHGRPSAWPDVLKGEWADNTGTNPHLTSQKYTGYGFVLRSEFNTKNEMYVNLQQIDDGPNYRWGRAADGGNGVIYYYAQGKRYSHNGQEDVGDGPFGDVERITNFGVKKAPGYRQVGPYRSVGRNDLTEPLYDLGIADLATVKANAKVSPDYISRSVMRSAADYIVVFDKVANKNTEGRFSWFVDADGEFPSIQQLKPGVAGVDADIKPSQSPYHKDPATLLTKGRYYDGKGSFLTLVTHKPSISSTATAYGCEVHLDGGQIDRVFRGDETMNYKDNSLVFSGIAGVIRQFADGKYAAALFDGVSIGIPGVTIQLNETNKAGISIETTALGFKGKFQSVQAEKLKISFTQQGNYIFYLDGIAVSAKAGSDGALNIKITAGKHSWQYSNAGVVPQPTQVLNTVVASRQVKVKWQAMAGASTYTVQLSKDGGLNWDNAAENITRTETTITNLTNDTKIHVRVVARGTGGSAEPSNEYPVYVSAKVSHAPEGLLVSTKDQQIAVTWGQVLGTREYKLYRREKTTNDATYQVIYTGADTNFKDAGQGQKVFEYVVTAINGNGESKKSTISDTDPDRFINWRPANSEGFRRDTRNHENGFAEYNPFVEETMPVLTYPKNQPSSGIK